MKNFIQYCQEAMGMFLIFKLNFDVDTLALFGSETVLATFQKIG
jgi:hypothetical protein